MKKFFLPAFFMLSVGANAQIVINEYSAANVSYLQDNYNEYEDWIELYNTTGSAVNLGGYFLSDKTTNPTKFPIPAGVSIPANGHIRIWCTGREEFASGNLHTNFRLMQTQPEDIILANPSGTVIDQVTMVPNQPNHSHGRTTDGAATWAVFKIPTSGATNNTATAFQEYEGKPVFNQAPGFYASAINLVLSAGPGTTIYYTLDGTTPTTGSTVYAAPINIAAPTVVRAIAVNSNTNIPTSFVETNSYFITVTHTIATVSVSGDQIATLLGGTQMNPDVCMEYFDPTGVFRTEATGTANEHGNDSWAYAQRGFDYISHDEYGISRGWLQKIFNTKPRTEFQRVIMKPAANDNYPLAPGAGAHIRDAYVHHLSQLADLHLDERSWEPCVLYVNGQYWGVYEIREKADDKDFCSYYFQQDEKFKDSKDYIQYLKTWGATWSDYGGAQAQADWDALVTFITSNDMSVAANYNYVDSVFNIKSLVDYFILNSYVVCADWLNWNTSWWRGLNPAGNHKKWRYSLWDMDATFGHYVNYTGIPNQGTNADPCDPNTLGDPGGQGHVPILNALMDTSQTFQDYYINRYIDLNNTTFSCTNMINVLDSMIAVIAPEMPGQIAKWGGTLTTWQSNVAALRDYIIARCDSITQGLMGCYDLTGPYNIIYEVDPVGAGSIIVNSIQLDNFPWVGTYYGGITTYLTAIGNDPALKFDHWEMSNSPSPSTEDSAVTVEYTSSQTVVAVFKADTEVIVPSAFSPNADGFNDLIRVSGDGIKTVTFSIYDRWGERIFSTSEFDGKNSAGWDGIYKGKKMPVGVYAYQIKATMVDNTEVLKSGNITLMR